MKPPLFSVLLPTRNRSEIVGGAIASVLAQSLGDFEIIVSDNDESPENTRQAVAAFTDPRVRYVRTSGQLPMHANWENAFDQAQGDYVLILEDKQRLVPNALAILHRWFRELGPVPLSYEVRFARGESIPAPPEPPPIESWSSRAAIELFCRFDQRFFNLLPKSLDSCAPRALLTRLKQQSPTGMLYSHISPDYASGFMTLAAVDRFYYSPAPLVYIPNNWMWQGRYSNGQSSFRKTPAYRKFLQDLPVTRDQILGPVPVKSEFLWVNAVLYDYRTFYRPAGPIPEIDWPSYYGFCCYLVLMGRKLGADMQPEMAEIRRALRHESAGLKARVTLDLVRRGLALTQQLARRWWSPE